jgi:hypothetical protein
MGEDRFAAVTLTAASFSVIMIITSATEPIFAVDSQFVGGFAKNRA